MISDVYLPLIIYNLIFNILLIAHSNSKNMHIFFLSNVDNRFKRALQGYKLCKNESKGTTWRERREIVAHQWNHLCKNESKRTTWRGRREKTPTRMTFHVKIKERCFLTILRNIWLKLLNNPKFIHLTFFMFLIG